MARPLALIMDSIICMSSCMAVMLGMHVQSITPSIIVPIDSPEEAPVVAGAAVVGAAVVVGGAVVVGATSVAKRQKFFLALFLFYSQSETAVFFGMCLSVLGWYVTSTLIPAS